MKKFQEDELLYARVDDLLNLSRKRNFPCFLGFLTEREVALTCNYLQNKNVNYRFYGGYDKAERLVLAVAADNKDIEDYFFPITPITVNYNWQTELSHRDFLGAIMGTGLKREVIGDILTEKNRAVIFVKDEIKEYLLNQVNKVGAVGVEFSECSITSLPTQKSFNECTYTLSSLRLDNVVSAVAKVSRDGASKYIKTGLVSVNALVNCTVSSQVKNGDKISIRGKGKFIVGELLGTTRKGRYKLAVKQYR